MNQGLSIAEAADLTGLTADTLRYYERDGLMLRSVPRAPSGHRQYADDDIHWIQLITKLRSTGMPIRDVRRYADLVRASTTWRCERSRSSRSCSLPSPARTRSA